MTFLDFLTAKNRRIIALEKALGEVLDLSTLHCDRDGCTYCGAPLLDINGPDGHMGYQIYHYADCVVSKWKGILDDRIN